MSYKNNNYKKNNNTKEFSERGRIQSEVQKLLNSFIQNVISNDKNMSKTVTNILGNINHISENDEYTFNGIRDSITSNTTLSGSMALTPVVYTYVQPIDLAKMFGVFVTEFDSETGDPMYEYGDIYDEYELKQVIEDICAKYYSIYYVEDMPSDMRESSYKTVIATLSNSLALYSMIVCAWSYQNMKEAKYTIAGTDGKVKALFSCEGLYNSQAASTVYPYASKGTNDETRIPFNFNVSNAVWLQKIISRLEYVWLPKQTAEFWRTIFGATFQLQNNAEVDRGAIQLVKFIPLYTEDFSYTDTNSYNEITMGIDSDFDYFYDIVNTLANTVSQNISRYPWLTNVLNALGCNFHGFTYHLDGSGNITSDKCDDFTRALIAKNLNVIYDADNSIRAILQANSKIYMYYNDAEETEHNNPEYMYVPAETVIYDRYASNLKNMFDCAVLTTCKLTSFYNPTAFSELLKGNLGLPILHVVTVSKSGTDVTAASNATVRVLYSPGYRMFFCVDAPNSLANITTLWQVIQSRCSIPMPEVVVHGTQQTVTSRLTQVGLVPFECYSIHDYFSFNNYTDIDRARAARRYLFMLSNGKSNQSSDNKSQKKSEKGAEDKDHSKEGKEEA